MLPTPTVCCLTTVITNSTETYLSGKKQLKERTLKGSIKLKTVYVNINDVGMKCWGETLLTTEMKQKWEYK